MGGLVLEEPDRLRIREYPDRGPKMACPCGTVRVVGGPLEIVTVDEREVEVDRLPNALIEITDDEGRPVSKLLMDGEAINAASLNFDGGTRLIVVPNPPACQTGDAIPISRFAA